MGAWGEKAFQNDSALDWVADLEEDGIDALHDVLGRVAGAGANDYLDVDDGSAAIAAAEIVAATVHGLSRLNHDAQAWLRENDAEIGDEEMDLARRAVERVLGTSSELCELWDEGGADNDWRKDVHALLVMLGGDPSKVAPPPKTTSSRRSDVDDVQMKQALLTFMQMRGLEPTDEELERIESSRDSAELQRWLARVVTAKSVAEMLDD